MIIIFIILISIVLIYIWKMWGVGNSVDVLYIKNFLPKDEHDKIKTECSRYNSSLEDDDLSIVKNRKMYKLQGDAYISKLFKSGRVRHRLKDLKVFPNNTPVEYRVYERGGAMDWHYDDQMYLIPQYEVVYTVDNTSDSKTEWIDPKTGKTYSISTESNSVFIVRATRVLHRVTPVGIGSRKILKISYSTSV